MMKICLALATLLAVTLPPLDALAQAPAGNPGASRQMDGPAGARMRRSDVVAPREAPAPEPQAPMQRAPEPGDANLLLFVNPAASERAPGAYGSVKSQRGLDGSVRLTGNGQSWMWNVVASSRDELNALRALERQIGEESLTALLKAADALVRQKAQTRGLYPDTWKIGDRLRAFNCHAGYDTCESGLIVTFKAFAPAIKPLVDSGRWVLVGEIDATKVLGGLQAKKDQAESDRSAAQSRTAAALAEVRAHPTKVVGMVLAPLNPPPASPSQAAQAPTVCATTHPDSATTDAFRGYLALEEFAKLAGLKPGASVTRTLPGLEELYAAVQARQCAVLMLTGAQAAPLAAAVERDRKFSMQLYDPKGPGDLTEASARAAGFSTGEEMQLARAIGARPSQMSTLRNGGVNSPAAFQALADRMVAAGYATDRSPSTVVSFLNDENEGRPERRTAVQVRQAREEALARKDREEAAARQREAEAMAKEFPYIAVLTCGMPRHINILACFAGESSAGATELELVNGQGQKVYKTFNLHSIGKERADGFYIDLRKGFALRAQNANTTLILGLKIVERASGKVLHESQAGHFRVVQVRE